MRSKRGNRDEKCCSKSGTSVSGTVYCLGLIGAAVYYIQHATSFWHGVLGVLKALVWPAFLVHKALEYLKM